MDDERAPLETPIEIPENAPAPAWEYGETSLTILADASWEEWNVLWNSVDRMQRSANWWVGDTLIHAQKYFPDRWTQVVSQKYVEQQKGPIWVCSRIPEAWRKKDTELSWSAHREAAALEGEDLKELLDRGASEGWTTKDMKAAVEAVIARQDNRRPRLRKVVAPQPEPEPEAREPAAAPVPRGTLTLRKASPEEPPRPSDPTPETPPEAQEAPEAISTDDDPAGSNNPPSEREGPLTVEDIRMLIGSIREIASDLALGRAPFRMVSYIEGEMRLVTGVAIALSSVDKALECIPDDWEIAQIKGGSKVFGGRQWSVDLRKGKTQRSIVEALPSLTAAICEAALQAIISDGKAAL